MTEFDNAAFLSALASNDLVEAERQLKHRDSSLAWRLGEANYLIQAGDIATAFGRLEEFRRSGRSHPIAEYLLGTIHQQSERWDEAIAAFSRALELRPQWARAEEALGCALVNGRRYEDAVQPLASAAASTGLSADGLLALGLAQLKSAQLEQAAATLLSAVRQSTDPSSVFQRMSAFLVTATFDDALDADAVMARYRAVGSVFDAAVSRLDAATDPDPDRRLRLGYIGPSLHRHVLADYLEPVLRHHDKSQVHVTAYAHVPVPDAVTRHLAGLVDNWVDIHGLSDDEAAARIQADRIDILVHFMGHWVDNRLPVLARKPAPVQTAYLCQSPSTALSAVDYMLTGPEFIADIGPPPWTSERVVVLPGGHAVTTDIAESRPATEPPVLSNGYITFGSFNNPAKINDRSLSAWAEILRALPTARLLLKGRGLDKPDGQDRFRERFRSVGGPADRLSFMGWVDAESYLEVYNGVDVVLDTFPFNGGRTTFEALWMGAPVVALTGRMPHERYSHIQLVRTGIADLSVTDAVDYVRAAVSLAQSPDRLVGLRGALREKLRASNLMDPVTHVRDLEAAYRWMWRRYCESSGGGA